MNICKLFLLILSLGNFCSIYPQSTSVYVDSVYVHEEVAYIDTLEVVTGEYPPTVGKDLKHYGYAAHMLVLAFESQGYKVNIHFLPWQRAYDATLEGKYDLSFWWWCSERRQNDFFCGDPLFETKGYFFHLKSTDFDWKDYSDLQEYKMGLTIGYAYTKELRKMVEEKKIKAEEIRSDLLNFKKLLVGRIDIFPITDIEGEYLINKHFSKEDASRFTNHELPFVITNARPLFPISNSNSRVLIEAYNKGIESLQKQGVMDHYLLKMLEGWYDK